MRKMRLLGFLVPLCLFMSLPVILPQKQAASTPKNNPLVDQSYSLSQTLGGREQLFYLVELCRLSDRLNLPVEKAKEYSLVLFNLASQEQDARAHAVGQKNAVTCLSYVDPAAAMELLPKISSEPRRSGEWLNEDHRYNAAETTFNNFLNSFNGKITLQGISNILAKARYLGKTGQYPYAAAAEVINRLPTSFRDEKNVLLRDALGFYETETGFYNRDQEFLLLLQSLNSPPIDRDLAARAVTTFVQRLKNNPIHFPGDYYAEIHIASTGRVFPFTDRNAAFLFQAFPQIKRFNSALAMQLRQQDPKLDQAADKMSYISGGFVQGDPTSEHSSEQHLRWLQESLVSRIRECQEDNPRAAAALAQRLNDLSSRIVGFSAAIPGIARTDRSHAYDLYEKQLSDLGNLSVSIGRLQAIVALVPVAYHLGDSKHYESLSEEAFTTGLRFFNSSGKTASVQSRDGFAELRDLAKVAASQAVNTLEARVQQLSNHSWLKAYLFLYEAEGQAKPKAAEVPVDPCSE